MSSQSKAYRWSPKHIGLIATLAFFVLIIFNQSEWKIRFLDWGLGALLVSLMLSFLLVRGRITKGEATVVMAPLIWAFYALIMTPFSYNVSHHLEALAQAFVLTLIASFVVIAVFSRERLASRAVLITVTLWTVINLMLLVLWKAGFVVYEGKDFAGLFGNRNAFAVQTVTLMAMMLFFVRDNQLFKGLLFFLSFVLVASSLSIKGFLFFFFILFFPLYLKSNLKNKILVVFSVLLVFGVTYASMPNIQERISRFSMAFTNPEQLRQSESAFLRAWLMVEGGKVILQNPIAGVGVDNARFVLIPPFMQQRGDNEGLYTHNNYVEMALNAGVVGLLFFYMPLLYAYFRVKKSHPYWRVIKTFTALYLLLGIAMVQYNLFISIFHYCLIIFLYFFHKERMSFAKNSIHS